MHSPLWRARFLLWLCSRLDAAEIATERVVLRSFDGRSAAAGMGHISVPADRRHPGRQFNISFYLLDAGNLGNAVPLVFLMGGPGVAATFIAQVPPYFDL